MRFKLILLFVLVLSGSLSYAQISNEYNFQDYKKKFEKESYVFLDLVTTDLYDLTKEGVVIESVREEKVLYLNNNAYNLSQRGLYYDQFSQISEIEGFSFNPVGSKYKREKVKKFEDEPVITGGVSFYSDSKNKKFQFPNLKEGSVSYLKYKTSAKDYHLLPQRTFMVGPYKRSDVKKFKVHKDIDLGFKLFNMEEADITFEKEERGNYIIYTWTQKETDKKEIYGNEDYDMYYTPHIVPYIKSFEINGEKTTVFENTADLYNWYTTLVEQVKPSEKESLKNLADSLTKGLTNEIDKVRAIYYWVQSQVKYIAFGDGYGGFVPRDPDLIYERRFGDCKDMTCLTINLLKEVEVPAYFTWVGTRHVPYGYTELSTPQVDNHMIATYISPEGDNIFLDATDSELAFGQPSAFIQGKEVLIGLDKDKFKVDNVPVVPADKNKEIDSAFVKIEEDKLVGTGKALFTGYFAGEVYSDFKGVDDQKLTDRFKWRLSKGTNKFISSNIEFELVNGAKDSLEVTYDFEIANYLKKIGNNIYLDLNLSKQIKDWKFDDKINTPIIINFKYLMNKVFELQIPSEYQLEYLPENKQFSNEFMEYTINYVENGHKINYDLLFRLKTIQVNPDQIEEWNKGIKKLSSDLDESLKLQLK